MPFQKGRMKTGGRQLGTKNKRTVLWEEFVQSCYEGGLEKFRIELDKLEGNQYVQAYLKVLEYMQPKNPKDIFIEEDSEFANMTLEEIDEEIEKIIERLKKSRYDPEIVKIAHNTNFKGSNLK